MSDFKIEFHVGQDGKVHSRVLGPQPKGQFEEVLLTMLVGIGKSFDLESFQELMYNRGILQLTSGEEQEKFLDTLTEEQKASLSGDKDLLGELLAKKKRSMN